jgi:hypothetical protein
MNNGDFFSGMRILIIQSFIVLPSFPEAARIDADTPEGARHGAPPAPKGGDMMPEVM